MSEKELQKRIRAERQLRKNIPEGCRWGRTASTASSTIATMIGTRGATMGYRTSSESSPGSDRGTVL